MLSSKMRVKVGRAFRIAAVVLLGLALTAIVGILTYLCPQENMYMHAMTFGIDLMVMASSMALCIICVVEKGPMDESTQVFFGILYVVFFNAFTDVLSRIVDGNRLLITANHVFVTASFLTTPLLAFFFWRYQATVHPSKRPLEKELTKTFIFLTVLDILMILMNIRFGFLYTISPEGFYVREGGFWLSSIFPMIILVASLLINFTKDISKRQKVGLLSFSLLPVAAIFVSIFNPKFALEYAASFLAILLLYGLVQVERGVELVERREQLMRRDQQLMISQIQPHFLYNTLSSIAYLCETNPQLACEVTEKFSDYLRVNMDSIERRKPVPFAQELAHVKTYVWIEELRFSNRLRVRFDIQSSDFELPALTVQPLVENAIKHGICKRDGGGTVRVYTFESVTHYYVKVIDNGAGFDLSTVFDDGKSHVGIANVRSRLESMCRGRLLIESHPDAGTTATIMIPKE